MKPFLWRKNDKELLPFPHITEFALQKNRHIRFNSLRASAVSFLRLYYIIDGKFEWVIDKEDYVLYPGDLAVILPGQVAGGQREFLDIGIITWLHISLQQFTSTGNLIPGKWSAISENENRAIGKLFVRDEMPVMPGLKQAGVLLSHIQQEISDRQIGFMIRINQLIDELFIVIARHRSLQNIVTRDFPKSFNRLESALRKNLGHQWTVKQMADLTGFGTTVFAEKVKNHTGYSPLNYLINLRVSEAIKLLKREDIPITDIALDTGFYSSQHFSTTFKKLTGYAPRAFREKQLLLNG